MVPRHLALLVGSALLMGGVSGCSRPVLTEPAAYAPDPVCGDILLALRGDRFGLAEVSTTSQATMAWGDADAAIVVRCGVEPPPPTTDRCIGVESSDGTQIDWINPESESELIPDHADTDIGSWTFITYGRVPAVELVVPAALGIEPADVLQGVANAVGIAPSDSACVSVTDVTR